MSYSQAKKIAKRVSKQILKNEKQLRRLSRLFGDLLYDKYRDHLAKLEVDSNGLIKSSVRNINLTNNSGKITNRVFRSEVMQDFNKLFRDSFKDLNKKNLDYFEQITDSNLDKLNKQIVNKMNAIVGVSGNNNGVLQTLLDPSVIGISVESNLMKSVTTNTTIQEAQKQLKLQLTGDGKRLGICEKFYYEEAHDTFSEYERTSKDNFAVKLDLNYAVYQGGLIRDSRPFCVERNGKVYSRETIESWNDTDWKGKKKDNNIIVDAGGYNCRHYYDWITYEMAKRLDPDIVRSRYDKEKNYNN